VNFGFSQEDYFLSTFNNRRKDWRGLCKTVGSPVENKPFLKLINSFG
jgi:hypothetical protein